MNILLVMAFLFFIGCVMGWGIELVFRRFFSKNNPGKKWINPGFLTGPWLPIYGLGLCGMFCVTEAGKKVLTGSGIHETILVLVVMTIFMTVIELIAGLFFTKFFKVKLWDYSREKFNYKGIICPKFSVAWGVLGCFYFFVINPYVLDGIIWLSQHLTFSFFIGMFFGVFAIDVVYSMQLAAKMKKFAEEKEIEIRYEELKTHIAQRREEMKQKRQFLLAFRTEESLHQMLARYADKLH